MTTAGAWRPPSAQHAVKGSSVGDEKRLLVEDWIEESRALVRDDPHCLVYRSEAVGFAADLLAENERLRKALLTTSGDVLAENERLREELAAVEDRDGLKQRVLDLLSENRRLSLKVHELEAKAAGWEAASKAMGGSSAMFRTQRDRLRKALGEISNAYRDLRLSPVECMLKASAIIDAALADTEGEG